MGNISFDGPIGNATLSQELEAAAGCIDAALAEGWLEALSDGDIERIRDLWERRLSFVSGHLGNAVQAVETMSDPSLLQKIAEGIEGAECGHSLKLTKLLDGVSTYTLTYHDGTPSMEFASIDEGYEHIREKRGADRAFAALRIIREFLGFPIKPVVKEQ
jgi:hypothetical protein